MDIGMQLLVDLANQECIKGSMNGPSLIETLRSLSPSEASSKDTYEGFSACSVALHVLYLKHMVSKALGATVPPYEYDETDFPEISGELTQQAWDKVIGEIETVHNALADELSRATSESLEKTFAAWKMPIGGAVAWLVAHDTAHNAQIRNMGLPSLRKKH